MSVVRDGGKKLEKLPQTDSAKARAEHAEICVNALKLSMPTVIDRDDNKVSAAYAGWPDRLYVVGVDGKIALMGEPGPRGFKPAEVEAWLKKNVPAKK